MTGFQGRLCNIQGEIDVILDLVSGIEDGQHLAIAGVTPGQKSLQSQNRERALALSAKQTQLQVNAPLPHQPTFRCAASQSPLCGL